MEDAFPAPSKPVSSRVASAAGSQRKAIDSRKGGKGGEVEKVHAQRGEGPEPPPSFMQFSATIGSLQDRLGEMDAQYGNMVRGRQASPLRPPPRKDMSMSTSLSSSNASSAMADSQSSDGPRAKAAEGKRLSHSGGTERVGEELDGSGPLPFVAGDAAGGRPATDNPLSRERDAGAGEGVAGEKEGRRLSGPSSTTSSASWPNLLPIRPLSSTGDSTISAGSSGSSGSSAMGRLDSSLRRLGGLREQLGALNESGSSIDRSGASDRQAGSLRTHAPSAPKERDHFMSLTGRLTDAVDRFAAAPVSTAMSAAGALRVVASKLVPPVLRGAAGGEEKKHNKRRRTPLLMVDSSPTVVHEEGEEEEREDGGKKGGKRRGGEESDGSASSESEDEAHTGLSSPTLASTWVEAEVKGTQRELSKEKGRGKGKGKGQEEKGQAEKDGGQATGTASVRPLLMARLQPRQGPMLQGMTLTGSPTMMATMRGQVTWRSMGDGAGGQGAEGSEDEGEGGAAAMYHTRTLRSNSGGALRRRKNSFSALSVAPEQPPEMSPTAGAGSTAEGTA
jgi:hypothetical protein